VYPEQENEAFLPLQPLELLAPRKALGVSGCGCEMFVLATRPLQFAKAGSAATLPQQEKKKNSVDMQRGSFLCTTVS
jgi:hypothetical protein